MCHSMIQYGLLSTLPSSSPDHGALGASTDVPLVPVVSAEAAPWPEGLEKSKIRNRQKLRRDPIRMWRKFVRIDCTYSQRRRFDRLDASGRPKRLSCCCCCRLVGL